MDTNKDGIAGIIYSILQGQRLSESEQALVDEWLQSPLNRQLFEHELSEEQYKEYLTVMLDKETTGQALAVFEQAALGQGRIRQEPPVASPGVHRIHFLRRAWLRYAAAVILLAGVAGYFFYRGHRPGATGQAPAVAANDVKPGGNKAVLTLGDGSTIVLDSAGSGSLARQGATTIVKTAGGQIAYQANGQSDGVIFTNILRVPKGGMYQLILPDGTRVWLNAASSISYPTVFTGKERAVTISGEAYFEVVKNPAMPFRVSVEGLADIRVLGTSFNINAYGDNADIRTTLLDGSVRVEQRKKGVVLSPGQQARVKTGDSSVTAAIRVVDHADIDKVMAWKSGYFNFEDLHFEEVMHQLERWYNIEIVYPNGVPGIQLAGEISRNLKLSDLLKGLEGAEVKFRLENGNRLVVLK